MAVVCGAWACLAALCLGYEATPRVVCHMLGTERGYGSGLENGTGAWGRGGKSSSRVESGCAAAAPT
eukprot:3815298-Rhodomonas_salina.1